MSIKKYIDMNHPKKNEPKKNVIYMGDNESFKKNKNVVAEATQPRKRKPIVNNSLSPDRKGL